MHDYLKLENHLSEASDRDKPTIKGYLRRPSRDRLCSLNTHCLYGPQKTTNTHCTYRPLKALNEDLFNLIPDNLLWICGTHAHILFDQRNLKS
jgi:hypothetical protein